MEPPAAPGTASRKRPQSPGPASSEIWGELSATELLAGAPGEAIAKEILAAYHSAQLAVGVSSKLFELGVLEILTLSDAGREILDVLSPDIRALAAERSWPAKAFEQCGCAQQCLRLAVATAEGMATLDAAALRLVLAQDRAAATPATKRGKIGILQRLRRRQLELPRQRRAAAAGARGHAQSRPKRAVCPRTRSTAPHSPRVAAPTRARVAPLSCSEPPEREFEFPHGALPYGGA